MNVIAAGEARESSLARLPEISAWRVPRRGSDECRRGSSAVERRPHEAKVVGSTPTLATMDSSVGRAIDPKSICRGFESRSQPAMAT